MPYTPYQSTWQNPYMPQVQQPQYSPVAPSVTTSYTQPINGTIKVNGPESAIQYGYRMPPNSTSQAIFDNNGKVFYIVTTDGAGMPSVESFDFFPHVEQEKPAIDGTQFVTRAEFDEFTASMRDQIGALNGLHAAIPATAAQPAAVDDAGQDRNAQKPSRRKPARASGPVGEV